VARLNSINLGNSGRRKSRTFAVDMGIPDEEGRC
jgi:hypothetical protein